MPSRAISNASVSSIRRSWPRVRPSARSSADSLVRSITDSDSVLAMPSSAISIASPSSTREQRQDLVDPRLASVAL